MNFRSYMRHKAGMNRYDLTHLMAQPDAFNAMVAAMAVPFATLGITKVAGLDAMGFGLAGGVAHRLGAGLALVRKGGRIAWEVETVSFTDYTGTSQTLEIAIDAVSIRDRILIVDDWSETGAQLKAAAELLQRCGAVVVGAACIHLEPHVRQDAELSGFVLHSVLPEA